MTFTAASHQRELQVFWLHFRGAVIVFTFCTVYVTDTPKQHQITAGDKCSLGELVVFVQIFAYLKTKKMRNTLCVPFEVCYSVYSCHFKLESFLETSVSFFLVP